MVKAKGELAIITEALRRFILLKAAQGTTSAAIIAQKVKAQWAGKNISADQVREVLESAGPDAIKAIREESIAKARAGRKQKDLGLERLLKIEKQAYKDAMNPTNGMSGNSIAALRNSWASIYKQVVQYQKEQGSKPEQSNENAALLSIVQELYLAMTIEQHALFDPRLKEKLGKEWDRIIGTKEQEGDAK